MYKYINFFIFLYINLNFLFKIKKLDYYYFYKIYTYIYEWFKKNIVLVNKYSKWKKEPFLKCWDVG